MLAFLEFVAAVVIAVLGVSFVVLVRGVLREL